MVGSWINQPDLMNVLEKPFYLYAIIALEIYWPQIGDVEETRISQVKVHAHKKSCLFFFFNCIYLSDLKSMIIITDG